MYLPSTRKSAHDTGLVNPRVRGQVCPQSTVAARIIDSEHGMKLRRVWMLAMAGALSPLAAYAGELPSQIAQDYASKFPNNADLSAPQLTLDPAKSIAREQAASNSPNA